MTSTNIIAEALPVVRLFNFFKIFRAEFHKIGKYETQITTLMKVFDCHDENDVLTLYPLLTEEVSYAFRYLGSKKFNKEKLAKVQSKILSALNQSRSHFYHTKAQTANPPIFLDAETFDLLESYSDSIEHVDSLDNNEITKIVEESNAIVDGLENRPDMIYSDKMFLISLLHTIGLMVKNYDKLTLSDRLSWHIIAFVSSIKSNDSTKNDGAFWEKIDLFIKKIRKSVTPDTAKFYAGIGYNATSGFSFKASGSLEYINNAEPSLQLCPPSPTGIS